MNKFLVFLVFTASLFGQQSIDNSTALSVIPIPIKDNFPGACKVGEQMYFSTGIPGANRYECGNTNNWILVAPGGSIPSTTAALKGNGSGGASAVTGTGTNCVLVNGSSATCGSGGGATIPSTTNVLIGSGTGNGADSGHANPVGAFLGTTDVQTTTGKTVDGVTPTVFGFLPNITSDVQAQLNARSASGIVGAVQLSNGSGGFASDATDLLFNTTEKVLLPSSVLMQNTTTSTGDIPLGVLLWGNHTYGCVSSPGVSDPIFGNCAPVQFDHTITDPTFNSDFVEYQINYNPTGNATVQPPVQIGTSINGTANVSPLVFYLPMGALAVSLGLRTTGTIGNAATISARSFVTDGATAPSVSQVLLNGFDAELGGTVGTGTEIYMAAVDSPFSDTPVTNPYFTWMDADGVGRCRYDNTFNAVHQAICVVYNPQFTKYTPGAANFERISYGQWESNIAVIGAEAGGTGTLRELRLQGQDLQIPVLAFAGLGTPSNSAEVYCSDCAVTSGLDDTCTGSGSGAWAERIAATWRCRI